MSLGRVPANPHEFDAMRGLMVGSALSLVFWAALIAVVLH